jgi:hypothetical protein
MSTELQSPPTASPPHYRAVSLWAVLSMVSGVATLTMFFGWALAFFPLAAIYCGRKALRQIQRMPEEYTGRQLAQAGIWLGAGLGIGFGGWLLLGGNEVPHGYRVLDYAELEPDPNIKGQTTSNAAQELSNNKTKVYVRGYMLPPQRGQWTGLTKFSICRNSDMCKFQSMGGMTSARPEDQIHIELTGDRTINYTSSQIGIGGVFSIDNDQQPQPYYVIKGDYIYH